MKTQDFSSCKIEDIVQYGLTATPSQIEQNISKMDNSQISALIDSIKENSCDQWEQKIRSAIIGLNSRGQLETAGSSLTIAQFMVLIGNCLHVEDKHHWKLSPLLVGIEHSTFSKIVEKLSDQQLQVFKDEGVTEPIQHHLTTLTHELESNIEKGEEGIDQLYEKVDRFQIEEIGLHDVNEVIREIELYHDFFDFLFKKSNKALAIAWNTKRLDLIESLNKIKGSCQKFVLYGLGSPKNDQQLSTGLYQLIEEKLFEVYGNSLDPNDTEAVRDSEPAVEGLVKLSVWYLRDYWEIGLLPHIKDKKSLDFDLETRTEVERVNYREGLFSKAQNNLSMLGLSTVSDLKNNLIFSKRSLQEFIQEKMPTIVQSD
ncbi:putative uncharacterized protein [Waddlia chondrophila 2032/99]|uniref:Uncharacterized protein n=1 Tax=Waddlia chondrophila 2032/99 TaxID=765953 RepID=F8LDX8_9BACT|nr:putative uncharacterized protein [Waddlia chondrophila 2032/99]